MHSGMFLDFLAGNQEAHCTPWGMPTRNIFGWQKPCYLLGEGYAKTFKELMETTEWDTYGTGAYEKCANCMAHCGYEPTAANLTIAKPLKALKIALFGVRTDGPMAPEISLANQRPAQYNFSAAGAQDADSDQCREGPEGGRKGRAERGSQSRGGARADASDGGGVSLKPSELKKPGLAPGFLNPTLRL